MKKTIFISLIVFLGTLASGCASEWNTVRAVNDPIDSQHGSAKVKEIRDTLSQYVGKNTSILRQNFGEPTEINKDVYCEGKKYQEEWYYYQAKGIPLVLQNSWAYTFYIDDNIIKQAKFLSGMGR